MIISTVAYGGNVFITSISQTSLFWGLRIFISIFIHIHYIHIVLNKYCHRPIPNPLAFIALRIFKECTIVFNIINENIHSCEERLDL